MTADAYLKGILQQIAAPTGAYGPGEAVRSTLLPVIREWAGSQLADFFISGSYAKATAIKGGTDVDLFISLKADTSGTLAEIYQKLATFVQGKGYRVRRQNVSIGINHSGLAVDLVPGRKQSDWSTDHSLYMSRQRTWQKTNVSTHARVIGGSGRTSEIRLLKRWRNIHSLEFPSFAVELAVLRALEGKWTGSLSSGVVTALEFLRDRLTIAALQDPANTNNNVADEMTASEKNAIATEARISIAKPSWAQVIW